MKHTTIRRDQPIEHSEERTLWLFHTSLHGEDRLWWAYFQDGLEIHVCLTEIVRAFPCLELKSLQPCWHGLRICSHFYPATGNSQQQQEICKQDQELFPLAPFACDYLTSFVKGLGDANPCKQCESPSLTKGSIETPVTEPQPAPLFSVV